MCSHQSAAAFERVTDVTDGQTNRQTDARRQCKRCRVHRMAVRVSRLTNHASQQYSYSCRTAAMHGAPTHPTNRPTQRYDRRRPEIAGKLRQLATHSTTRMRRMPFISRHGRNNSILAPSPNYWGVRNVSVQI